MKIPALIDTHVHLRDFNQSDKATIETETQAAIAGGYSVICGMPNSVPVLDNLEMLKEFKKRTSNQPILIYPICAITKGLNSNEIVDFEEFQKEGAIAFSNDGRPIEDMGLMREVLSKAKESKSLIISHAECFEYEPEDNKSEYKAVERELEALKDTKSRLHFAHISTKESVELIRDAKMDNHFVTAETAPHYFSLTEEDRGYDGRFKMNPPLRSVSDVNAIIEGLQDGTIDCIATDHAPHRIDEKIKPYEEAPFGIVGLETALSVSYTYLVYRELLDMEELIEKMSSNPAMILGIDVPDKFIEFDPEYSYRVDEGKLKSKCKITPYNKMFLKGKIND